MTSRKGAAKTRKARNKKPRVRRKTKPAATRRKRRNTSQMLDRRRHATKKSRRLPRTRRALTRHQGVLRRPGPNAKPRHPHKPKLKKLSPQQRSAVDRLLLRVYQHAARELTELEAKQIRKIRQTDLAMEKRYAAAREEIMQVLREWERQHTPESA